MSLIDNYISEVGKYLPKKNREDIQAEIRSALQDMLDDRTAAGRELNDDLVLEVLKEYGSPERVAASYQGERYLIGPRLYPAFERTIRIALPIIGVLALIGLSVALARMPLEGKAAAEQVGQALSDFFGSFISVLGMIVLVFAILERTMPNLKTKPEDWDPKSLYKVSLPDRISIGEPIMSVIFTLAVMILFNFFPNIIGFTWPERGEWTSLPILSQTFWSYLPVLNLLWTAQVVLYLSQIYRGQWAAWMRWLSLGVHGLEVGIAIAMVQGPSLIGLTADQLAGYGPLPVNSAQVIVTMLHQVVRFTLIIIIVVGIANLVREGIALVGRLRAPVMIKG